MIGQIARSVLFLGLMTIGAQAATLGGVIGDVSVNAGGGFVPASDGANVLPGDRVRVALGGAVRVVYSSSCAVPVAGGQTVTIPVDVPCAPGGLANGQPNFLPGALAVGAGIAMGSVILTDNNDSPPPPVSP